jgi:hypothetical protein
MSRPPNRSLHDFFGPARKQSKPSSNLRFYSTPDSSSKKPTRNNASISIDRPDPNSKKATVNGQEVILGSDDEPSDLDDDDALPNLDELLDIGRREPAPRPVKPVETKENPNIILEKIKRDAQKRQQEEQRLAQLEAELLKEREPLQHARIDAESIKKVLLANGTSEEDRARAQKTLEALRRTEALDLRPAWHFFSDSASTVAPQRHKFPKNALPTEQSAEPLQRKNHFESQSA